jgi:capsular exopolysaccharide synthesis family protein
MKRSEGAALGKFYEAMQRAANSSGESSPISDSGKQGSTALNFDETLLNPEGAGTADASSRASWNEASVSSEALRRKDPADCPRAHIREAATSQPVESVLGSSTPLGGSSEIADEQKTARSPFSTARLVDTGVFRSPTYAAYERVTQKLLKYRRTPRQSLILVTSAVGGEGTSTVARNTALALGRHETEKILLVDANIRNPAQHEAFGLEREVGLSDVLLGVAPLTSAIRGEDASEMSIMTAGSKVPSPAQLLAGPAFQGLVTSVLSMYDWVIIDGPPVTAYPDSASIAAVCGGALLVTRAESTRLEVVEEAKRILEETGVDLLGAVLNRRRYHIPAFIYRWL